MRKLTGRDSRIITRGRWLLWAIIAFFLLFFVWANFAKLNEVTRGNGRIIPSSEVQIVKSLEGGILQELLVAEGDTVEQDQLLMRIDDVRFASNYQESRVDYLTLLAAEARLRAEIDQQEYVVPAEVVQERADIATANLQLHEARQREYRSIIDVLEQQQKQKKQELTEVQLKQKQMQKSLHLAQQELNITQPLVKQGVMSQIELLRLQREVNDLEGNIEALISAQDRLRTAMVESESRIREQQDRFRSKALQELSETTSSLKRLQESLPLLQDRLRRTAVRSPVRGIVKSVHLKTLGGVIEPAGALVDIVPLEDRLLVEVAISPTDIAFIHPGQQAVVKLTAYDFAIYGGINATVEQIGADTIIDNQGNAFYRTILRTEQQSLLLPEGEEMPLISGMVAEVDILTGKKTILDYILKPILKAKQRAMTER